MMGRFGEWCKDQLARAGAKAFTASLLQLLLLFMLLAGFLNLVLPQPFFIGLQAALSLAYFFLLLVKFRPRVRGEFFPYAVFFFGVWAFAQLAWLLRGFGPGQGLQYSAWLLAALIAFFVAFRFLFAKRTADAKVLVCDGKWAAVHVGFDLLAGVSAGSYVVSCTRRCKRGDAVKVAVVPYYFYSKPQRTLLK